jgi:hypothetical protein
MSQATGAVVCVYESMKDAEAAVTTLLEQGVPAEQVSMVGQDPLPPGEHAKFPAPPRAGPPDNAGAHSDTTKVPPRQGGNHATQQDGSTD